MALQSSGAISFSQIKTELTSSSNSLRALSAAAGFSSPDAVSEFYGYTSSLPPTVVTFAFDQIGETSIRCGGAVNSDNGATITERGFYFGTSTNRASNPKYTVSGTVGYYTLNRTGLSPNTTYRCWAYATNASGTTYGPMVTATTYQVYNPTYASMYTSAQAVFYGISVNGAVQAHDMWYEAFYRNPYSGGYVQYYARNYSNFDSPGEYRQLYFSSGSRFAGSPSNTAATNTKNYVRLLYNTGAYGLTGGGESYSYLFMNPGSGSFSNQVASANGGQTPDQSTGTSYMSAYAFNYQSGLTTLQLDAYFDYS